MLRAPVLAAASALALAVSLVPAAEGKRRCHSSYKGACLKVDAGDYDCLGGSGNGPNYVRGPVRVVGPDTFRLDADRDGLGCE